MLLIPFGVEYGNTIDLLCRKSQSGNSHFELNFCIFDMPGLSGTRDV